MSKALITISSHWEGCKVAYSYREQACASNTWTKVLGPAKDRRSVTMSRVVGSVSWVLHFGESAPATIPTVGFFNYVTPNLFNRFVCESLLQGSCWALAVAGAITLGVVDEQR